MTTLRAAYFCNSSLVPAEPHVRRRLRFGVGAHVHQGWLAAGDGALNRRRDVVRLLDEFAVAAQRLDHLVVALETQLAADVIRPHVARRATSGLARGEPR